MSETGSIVAVDVVKQGALVDATNGGAEPTESSVSVGTTDLYVTQGWTIPLGVPTEFPWFIIVGSNTYSVVSVLDPGTVDGLRIIELASGLVSPLVDGDFVEWSPGFVYKVAQVQLGGHEEPVTARVPHSLYDRINDTVRGNSAEYETVELITDGQEWMILDVLGKEPVIDGAFLDPFTVPTSPDVDAALEELADDLTELNEVTLPALEAELEAHFPITETDIADDAISTPKLQANAITAEKIAAGTITAEQIAADSITANELAAGAIVADEMVGQSIRTKLAIADEIYVAGYLPDDDGDGESEVDPTSNVISMSSSRGFEMRTPTGELDDQGRPIYDPVVQLPTQSVDEAGNPIAAVFRGRVISDDITVLQGINIQGNARPTVNIVYAISDTPTSYTITVDGQTTSSILYGAAASYITTQLEALSNIQPGDVRVVNTLSVTRPNGIKYGLRTIEFVAGVYSRRDMGSLVSVTSTPSGKMWTESSAPYMSHVAQGSRLVLDNTVKDPEVKPTVNFQLQSRNWTPLSAEFREIGWGTNTAGNVVTGRVHTTFGGSEEVHIRIINPTTGLLVSEQSLAWAYDAVAGFTANGAYAYVLGKNAGVWNILRFTMSTGDWASQTFNVNSLVGAGANSAAVSYIDGNVHLVARDTDNDVRVYRINSGLTAVSNTYNMGINTSRTLVGVVKESGTLQYRIGAGNRVFWSNNGALDDTKTMDTTVGVITGFGETPDARLVMTNQSGNLYVINRSLVSDGTISSRYSFYDEIGDDETKASLPMVSAWPRGMFASTTVSPPPPGTTNAKVYLKQGAGAERSWTLPNKQTTLADIAKVDGTTGGSDVPPASSEFGSGLVGPGCLESDAQDPSGAPLVAICGDGVLKGEGAIPVSTMWHYAGATAPVGWAFCNGAAISRTAYAKLFGVIGTTYGAGDGSTTFNLPDARSRFLVGAGTFTARGGTDGNAETLRTTAHDHGPGTLDTGGPRSGGVARGTAANQAAGPDHTHPVTGRTGMGMGPASPADSQFPRLGVNIIIRTV